MGHLAFLEQVVVPAFYRRRHRIYLIQDNASYHKKQETYEWFKANRRYVEVFQLPPYWPELNATERIWNYTRKHVTQNRFFELPQDLCDALFRRFDFVRQHPQEATWFHCGAPEKNVVHARVHVTLASVSMSEVLSGEKISLTLAEHRPAMGVRRETAGAYLT